MTHTFDTEIAEELDIESAIILSNFTYWILKNIANNKNIHDGKAWTYNSYETLEKLFPYIKKDKIKRVILSLEKQDILVSRIDLNKSKFDKTKWYTFGNNPIVKKLIGDTENSLNSDVQSNVQNCTLGETNLHDGEDKSAPSIKNNNQRQIINTDNKPDIINNKKFSFSLNKSSQFENTSREYQEKLKGYAVIKDGANSFNNFLDHHIAKGSLFKDWSRAYNTWVNNSKKFNKYNAEQFTEVILDETKGLKLYAEYGSCKLYSENFDYVADKKVQATSTEVQQDNYNHMHNTGAINSLMQNVACGVRA